MPDVHGFSDVPFSLLYVAVLESIILSAWWPISEQTQAKDSMSGNESKTPYFINMFRHVCHTILQRKGLPGAWDRSTCLYFSGASLHDHLQPRSKSILLPWRGDSVSHANGCHQTCLCLAVDWDGGTWFRRPLKRSDCSWGIIRTASWQHFQSNYIEGVAQTVTGLCTGLLGTIYNASTPFGTAISNQSLDKTWATQQLGLVISPELRAAVEDLCFVHTQLIWCGGAPRGQLAGDGSIGTPQRHQDAVPSGRWKNTGIWRSKGPLISLYTLSYHSFLYVDHLP